MKAANLEPRELAAVSYLLADAGAEAESGNARRREPVIQICVFLATLRHFCVASSVVRLRGFG
jgi:hypothetical protein